jgi:DNA polymerase III gamma/tau subunit
VRKKIETTSPAPEPGLPIHLKYRPQSFAAVRGQDAVVKSLRVLLEQTARPHSFLFVGDPGTGKTTLARILTAALGVEPANVLEIDAATNNGVDVMRDIMAPLRYQGFGASPNKAVILDEAHMLTKQAWASLLKVVEEPPPHVFFFFCTTDGGKVPPAIVTRCQAFTLRSVGYDDLMDLLDEVVDREQWRPAERVLELVASAANGSPRHALVMLASVHACADVDEAARILETPLDNAEVIDLCRLLVGGSLTWPKLCTTLKALGDTPAESIRIVVVNYLNACLLGARSDRDAVRLLDILECFSKPANPSDKLAPLLLAFGRYIFP